MTSHDVVNRARRALGCRRVGHAGTLDPMATGVLVLCVGHATRVVEYLPTEPKVYEASVVFGIETDTLDVTGRETRRSDASELTKERIEAVLDRFRGPILQIPPMVSALQVGGRRLYELARQGREVERQPRPVTIYALDLTSFAPGPRPVARMTVSCSAGAYIRSLAADIGADLGCGAALSGLRRTRAGRFAVEDACSPDGPFVLTPVRDALDGWPVAEAGGQVFADLKAGRAVSVDGIAFDRAVEDGARALVVHGCDEFAVAVRDGDRIRPVKVAAGPEGPA
jgi:tRNA pseudouridine55 synthase